MMSIKDDKIVKENPSTCRLGRTRRDKDEGGGYRLFIVVYYESMKRKLKIKPIYVCRCDGSDILLL
jgi:hypothetical protein